MPVAAEASPLALMNSFYESEFGSSGFVRNYADSLAAREALKEAVCHPGVARAFDEVLERTQDADARLRFSAMVASLASPTHPDNQDNNPFRFGLFVVASHAMTATLVTSPPRDVFQTLTEYPDYFTSSPHVSTLALKALKALEKIVPTEHERALARQASAHIRLSQG